MNPERRIGRIIASGLIIGSPIILSACESSTDQQSSDSQKAHTLVIPTPTFPGFTISPTPENVLAPTPEPKQTLPALTTEQGIRKEVGKWEVEDIERVANTMMSDPRFTNIVHAGEILLGSQQVNKVISSESSLFSDDSIRIETVQNLESDYPNKMIPMDARVSPNQPILITSFKSKNGGKDLALQTGMSLRLDRIRVSHDVMDGKSDFLFQLFLAKEVNNIRAFDIVTSIFGEPVFSQYDIPENEAIRNSVRTYFIKGADRGAEVSKIADLLAHFLILPDYNLAKDLGMFTEEEQSYGNFWVLDTATGFLTQSGVLAKDPDGVYRWKGDTNTTNQMLYRVAWSGIKANILE